MNLFGLGATLNENELREITRKGLNNLLTSYADEADVFNEIIQNSVDSVVKAKRDGLYQQGEAPSITVVIGRRTQGHHYFLVSDNGVGMSPTVAEKLTVPGYSYGKKKGKTLGYKGVGASYFFAASKKVCLRTMDPNGEQTEYTVRNSFEWIKNEDEPPPTVTSNFEIPDEVSQFAQSGRGTTICFFFHEGITPPTLSNLVVTGGGAEIETKNWMCFLASKTALGAVVNFPDVGLKIRIVLHTGDDFFVQNWTWGDFDREMNIVGYPFPYRVLRNAKSASELDSLPEEQRVRHTRKYNAIHRRWTAQDIIDQIASLDSDEKERLSAHLDWVDGYFCYSTDVMKELNARLGGRNYLIRHGIRIAVDGIPQGRNVDLSLTSNQGLDRQAHIVISFKGLELDTGRKISADETITSAIAKIGRKVMDVLKEYRWAMRVKGRPEIAADLATWRTSVEARSSQSLVKKLFEAAERAPILRVDPENESEVIALFVALIDQEWLKGYRITAISGYARYDALCDVDAQSTHVKNLDDQFSVRSTENSPHGTSKVLEFKNNFDALIQDFEEKSKLPSEIDFVVCWDVPNLNVGRGRIEPTYGDWRDNRSIYGGSYRWYDDNESSTFPIISLRNFVSELLSKMELSLGEPGLGTITFRDRLQLDKDQSV
jgi:hypothetical protein